MQIEMYRTLEPQALLITCDNICMGCFYEHTDYKSSLSCFQYCQAAQVEAISHKKQFNNSDPLLLLTRSKVSDCAGNDGPISSCLSSRKGRLPYRLAAD
jgi:hypothetical protein